ncbi:hypothetical protein LOK49_LG12G01135 [Camellia lanceoleosa]|uniref:Uncharacterized protein n=1 Tax=Camellia lanceoleosa TaxID=1840588 RepID=A0ACC0FTG9_9ERIC|nr:hypothetical protein LOK49_LG12G01135 [Camellia lanceoleosa]
MCWWWWQSDSIRIGENGEVPPERCWIGGPGRRRELPPVDSFFRRFISEDDHRLYAVRCGEPEEIGKRIRIEQQHWGGNSFTVALGYAICSSIK